MIDGFSSVIVVDMSHNWNAKALRLFEHLLGAGLVLHEF